MAIAKITTRQDFEDYCLRRLGAPVLQINIAPEQINDRVDEAIQFWQFYHSDGTCHDWYAHQVTAADKVNKYVVIPNDALFVTKIVPFQESTGTGSWMSNQWQYQASASTAALDMIGTSGGGGMTSYYLSQMNMSNISHMINGKNRARYCHHAGRLNIMDDLIEGDYLLIETFRQVDPDTTTNAWDDYYLKRYATGLMKLQWGTNLKKFTGMQLPGGVQFDGQVMYQEATEELRTLEEECRSNWEMPIDFYVG